VTATIAARAAIVKKAAAKAATRTTCRRF
jgi:hypothetical protein